MMKPCDLCANWAQWRARSPVYEADRENQSKRKLAGWNLISILCGPHKLEQEAMESNKDLKFDFVGSIPASVRTEGA